MKIRRFKKHIKTVSFFLSLIVFTVLGSFLALKYSTKPLYAQTSSYWNVERDGSNNLNFYFVNNGANGRTAIQVNPTGGVSNGSVGVDSGITGARPYSYLYQESGAWSHPYPDLVIGYHTGMKLGSYFGYGGIKFFNDHPSQSTTQLFSVGDGDQNVRVSNWLMFPNVGYGIGSPHNNAYLYPNNGTYGSWRVAGSRNGWYGMEFDTNAGQMVLMMGHSTHNSTNIHTGVYNASNGAWHWYAAGNDMYAGTYRDIMNGGYYLDPNGSSNLYVATFAGGPYTNDWFRVNTSGGIYWQAYGGGWHMQDSTYIRSYGNKIILAPSLMDQDNPAYYLNPAGETKLDYTYSNYFRSIVNDSWFPHPNGWNYIRGNTFAFNAPWHDENNSGYFIDPASNSVFQRIGIRRNPPLADLDIKQTDNSQGGAGGIRLERADSGGFGRIFAGSDQQLYLFTNSNNQYCIVTIYASISCASDRRLKENIQPLTGSGLEIVSQLKPSLFDWKNGAKNSPGFIAQEVAEILPNAVSKNPEDGYLSVSDSHLTPYIVKAVQELDIKTAKTYADTTVNTAQLEQLSEQVKLQQEQIELLKIEIEALKRAKNDN